RLPSAVRAEQADHLARADLQVDLVHRDEVPERAGHRHGLGGQLGHRDSSPAGTRASSRARMATVTASWRPGSTAGASPAAVAGGGACGGGGGGPGGGGGGWGGGVGVPGVAATICPGVPLASTVPASRTSTSWARSASSR